MALLQQAAEAGLANDPEFRSAFGSYIEWGTRLAVENSQIGAEPPGHMPMPHRDRDTAAGPPGSRVSALAPPGTTTKQSRSRPADGRRAGPVRAAHQAAVPPPRPAVHELRVRPSVP